MQKVPKPLAYARGSGSARTRLAAVMLAGYCAFLALYSPQPILPLLGQVFHAGEVTVSLTLTVASLGVALAAPIAGVMADRFGRKRIILWSAFGLAVSALLTATSTNLPTLIFWRFWQGIPNLNRPWPRSLFAPCGLTRKIFSTRWRRTST